MERTEINLGKGLVRVRCHCCLNHLKSVSLKSLPSGFRNRLIRDQFCSTDDFGSDFPNRLGSTIYETEFRTRLAFFFLFCSCSTFNFSSANKTVHLIVTVAILSLYQSSDNCGSRKVEDNFSRGVGYRCYCNFPGLKFVQLPEIVEDFGFQGV